MADNRHSEIIDDTFENAGNKKHLFVMEHRKVYKVQLEQLTALGDGPHGQAPGKSLLTREWIQGPAS